MQGEVLSYKFPVCSRKLMFLNFCLSRYVLVARQILSTILSQRTFKRRSIFGHYSNFSKKFCLCKINIIKSVNHTFQRMSISISYQFLPQSEQNCVFLYFAQMIDIKRSLPKNNEKLSSA